MKKIIALVAVILVLFAGVIILALTGCAKKGQEVKQETASEVQAETPERDTETGDVVEEESSKEESSEISEEESSRGEEEEKAPLRVSLGVVTEDIPYEDYSYVVLDEDVNARVEFISDTGIKDFAIYWIQMVSADDEGHISFNASPAYTTAKLEAGRPLIADITFIGDTPNYGVSFTDNSGETKWFAVEQSGMDGSLFLTEIDAPAMGVETVSEQYDINAFADVLNDICELARSDSEYIPEDVNPSMFSIAETMWASEEPDRMKSVGVYMDDLNEDGMPELYVVQADPETDYQGSRVISAFTMTDDGPALFMEGSLRNRYYILDDGKIFQEGSGGAMNAVYGIYSIGKEAIGLNPQECYFTDEEDGRMVFFRNTTGVMDKDASERLDTNEEAFAERMAEYESRVRQLDLMPVDAFEAMG